MVCGGPQGEGAISGSGIVYVFHQQMSPRPNSSAHDTGTPVGEPIEVEALSTDFGSRPGRTITLGSVKINMGHSEAVSGISSVIKTTLAIESRMIPPRLESRH